MLRHNRLAAVGAAAVLAAATATAASASSTGSAAANHREGAPLDHIFVIMLENHSQSSVIGDPNAPYLSSLADQYPVADQYYGVTHPSMPNYLAFLGGDTYGLQDDNDQNVVNLDRPNLVDELEAHHLGWDAYFDTLPADKLARFGPTLSNGTTVSLYAKKHNPFVLFSDIADNPARLAHVKDYTALADDLNSPRPPAFVWITPNQCNDMHGGVYSAVPGHAETPCPYGSAKDDANDAALKAKADQFVHTAVDTITGSRAWTRHSAIVIVTDENDFTGNETTGGWESADGCCDSPYVPKGDPRVSADWPGGTYGGGLIPAIIVTGSGPRHLVSQTPYNHYSLLATIEANWHLDFLGHSGDLAGGVQPMWDLLAGD